MAVAERSNTLDNTKEGRRRGRDHDAVRVRVGEGEKATLEALPAGAYSQEVVVKWHHCNNSSVER